MADAVGAARRYAEPNTAAARAQANGSGALTTQVLKLRGGED